MKRRYREGSHEFLCIFILFLFSYLTMCECFDCHIWISASCVWSAYGHKIPWDRSYWYLRTILWVLGTKPGSSVRQMFITDVTSLKSPFLMFKVCPYVSVFVYMFMWGGVVYRWVQLPLKTRRGQLDPSNMGCFVSYLTRVLVTKLSSSRTEHT